METSLQPKKLVFDYAILSSFFPKDTPPQQMKEDIIKVLTHWKNKKYKQLDSKNLGELIEPIILLNLPLTLLML